MINDGSTKGISKEQFSLVTHDDPQVAKTIKIRTRISQFFFFLQGKLARTMKKFTLDRYHHFHGHSGLCA